MKASKNADITYRVWIEKHESGWVTVVAPSVAIAEDRAQRMAERGVEWNPEHSSSTPCVALVVPDGRKART